MDFFLEKVLPRLVLIAIAWNAASYLAGNVFQEGLAVMTLADIGRAMLSVVVFFVVLALGGIVLWALTRKE